MRICTAFTFALLAGFAGACGPSAHGGANGDGGAGDDGGGGDDGGNNTAGACSSDLHDVLDGSGNVIATCPDDQGCANGMCVPACQAAAASNGSVGCDFVVGTPAFLPTYDGSPIVSPCFAVFLANNWPTDTAITISRGSATYSAATFGRVPDGTVNAATWPAIPATGIASMNVGVLFLSEDPGAGTGTSTACPITPALDVSGGGAVWNGTDSETGIGQAFHITTSVPVSAYDIMPYGGASSLLPSAELLLPTTAWGSNYIAVGPKPTTGPGWGAVAASQDGTVIQISPNVALPAGSGVSGAPAHTVTSYTLNAGQFLQWLDAGDMAGAIISSNNPISFTGGTAYLCLSSATSSGGGCDSGHQLIPPVSALASLYVAPPYATRRSDLQPESIIYRVVGTAAGTTLTYSPAITGAPPTLGVGEVEEFQTTEPFTIASQDAMHPFYVGQYMSGCEVTSGSRSDGCLGDEEFVNIVPPAQWLSSYVFFTDPTYDVTNLVVTRAAAADGTFKDVTVDCLGVLAGWQPVGDGTQYETTTADIQRGTPIGTCTNGGHTATSTGAFNVMVWGESEAASYAYPAGGNVGKINSIILIP